MAKKGINAAMIDSDGDWRAESDLRALCEADEIKKDPKRLAAAQAVAKEKLASMGKVIAE